MPPWYSLLGVPTHSLANSGLTNLSFKISSLLSRGTSLTALSKGEGRRGSTERKGVKLSGDSDGYKYEPSQPIYDGGKLYCRTIGVDTIIGEELVMGFRFIDSFAFRKAAVVDSDPDRASIRAFK